VEKLWITGGQVRPFFFAKVANSGILYIASWR